jgi:hypothetical protein
MEVIASRVFNMLYIYLDIAFLAALALILYFNKRRLALLFGLCGAILYFIVDYGIFYAALGTRTVTGASTFWLLLWLSASYGFTNFVWIWLWLDRDKRTLEWSLLIVMGWLATALLSQNFPGSPVVAISRGTADYHGVMALIMLVGYAILIVSNLRGKKYNIPWILAIGILVQFAWEAVLLLTGIRAQGVLPLIVNSLLETNLGLPYIFLIHRAVTKRFHEDLSRRDLSVNSAV